MRFQNLATNLVSKSYVEQGIREINSRQNMITDLLSRRRLPEHGWDETSIERLISDLALMDSNNFNSSVGAGEREARVACPLVSRRNFGMAHGIGRSGDIAAEQPKAAGSTLMTRICTFLVADALRLAGLSEVGELQVLPLATGMAMTLTLLSLRASRPDPSCRFALWFRIDQKTCLKAITSANLVPVVLEPRLEGDELRTDCEALRSALERLGPENVCCVITTTSCFAPRGCDDVEAVARVSSAAGVPHVVNNAYGVQSAAICKELSRACRVGRVDAVVQSTDKNFMVPVGGAVVWAPRGRPSLVQHIARAYPGRASAAAHLDLTMTLLYWGRRGWLAALREREELFTYLEEQLERVAAANGERVLRSPRNPISLAMTLTTLDAAASAPSKADAVAPHPAAAADGDALRPENVVCDRQRDSLGALGGGDSAPERSPGHADRLGEGPDGGVVAEGGTTPALTDRPGACGAEGDSAVLDHAAEEAVAGSPPLDGDSGAPGLPAAAEGGPVCGRSARAADCGPSVTFLGAMLWQRNVSGVRVIARGKEQVVAGCSFKGYGSSCSDYPVSYLTAAAALGGTKAEIDVFVTRLQKCMAEFRKRM